MRTAANQALREAYRKPHKYRAIATTTPDGIRHPSKKQAKRWLELKLLEDRGEIKNLRREVSYPLVVNGIKVGTYRADHRFDWTHGGGSVVEDVKGVRTDIFRMKALLMEAIYGIKVQCV